MEEKAPLELSQDAEQRLHAAIADCLAIAQKRLVSDVQRLAAEICESVNDQFVKLQDSCMATSPITKFETYLSSALVAPLAEVAKGHGEESHQPLRRSDAHYIIPQNCAQVTPDMPDAGRDVQGTPDLSDTGQMSDAVTMHSYLKDCQETQEPGFLPEKQGLAGKRRVTFKSAARAALFTVALKGDCSSRKQRLEERLAMRVSPRKQILEERGGPEKLNGGLEVSFSDPLSPKTPTYSMASAQTTASHLSLQSAWVEMPGSSKRLRLLRRTFSSGLFCSQPSESSIGSIPETDCCHRLERYILRPGHPACLICDLLTAVAMIHDVVVIPLTAFDLPESPILDVMGVLTTIIWAIDLFLSFFRGVADRGEGVIEMRPRKIARIYLKSWFILDFTVVGVDILLLCAAGNTSWVGIILLVRMLRVLRLMRIAKIMKLSERMAERFAIFEGRFAELLAFSEKKNAGLSILKLLSILVVINHFVACGWYGIGSLHDGDDSWVSINLDDRDAKFSYRYGTAFHWAVTQFTPASMEVFPRSTIERAYNIFVIFGGLLMFSSVISSMTQAQLYIQKISAAQKQQRQSVQRYMAANSVSIELSSTILLFLKRREEGPKMRLNEQDVDCFSTLPEHMVVSLRVEVYVPTLIAHGIFTFLQQTDMHTMSMICHNAVSGKSVLRSEDVFAVYATGKHMYFVTGGRLAYFLGYEAMPEQLVERGRWISEHCLWVRWDHCGRLSGEARCSNLVQVSSTEFLRFACQSEVASTLQGYARRFAATAVQDAGGAELVTDLWGGPDIVRSLISRVASNSTDRIMRLWMSTDLLKHAFLGWKRYMETPEMISRNENSWLGGSKKNKKSLAGFVARRGSNSSQHLEVIESKRGAGHRERSPGHRGRSPGHMERSPSSHSLEILEPKHGGSPCSDGSISAAAEPSQEEVDPPGLV